MKNIINKNLVAIMILMSVILVSSCSKSDDKKKEATAPAITSTSPVQPAISAPVAQPGPVAKTAENSDMAVSVDGKILKKSELEKDLKERINAFKSQIPKDKLKETRDSMKKQMIDEFIMRTLLAAEVEKNKITATEKEINESMNQIKASLPPGKKLDAFLKENKVNKEDIILGIKVRKLVNLSLGKKLKPTANEISKFYKENSDKFVVPENVHVRHILITIAQGDDEKIKTEKKSKIENLRKQIVEGADFAEIAKNNSDCPSKENGGDLGQIRRGQTVKPFEDAAFSQENNVVGPIVTTEFGYHIIQVLEHNAAKTVPLEEAKGKIAAYLEQQKQSEAFTSLLKKLRDNAKIVLYEN